MHTIPDPGFAFLSDKNSRDVISRIAVNKVVIDTEFDNTTSTATETDISDDNWTRTHNYLVCKRTLNHLECGFTLKRLRDMMITYS